MTSDGTLRMVVFMPVEVPDLIQIELTMDENRIVVFELRGYRGKITVYSGTH